MVADALRLGLVEHGLAGAGVQVDDHQDVDAAGDHLVGDGLELRSCRPARSGCRTRRRRPRTPPRGTCGRRSPSGRRTRCPGGSRRSSASSRWCRRAFRRRRRRRPGRRWPAGRWRPTDRCSCASPILSVSVPPLAARMAVLVEDLLCGASVQCAHSWRTASNSTDCCVRQRIRSARRPHKMPRARSLLLEITIWQSGRHQTSSSSNRYLVLILPFRTISANDSPGFAVVASPESGDGSATQGLAAESAQVPCRG